ncbi:MAG: NADH-quinone oxidoreductase subunit NuoK [Thaumarchaeota archaeon]|nr:NADH-quinone oxidoreductase subunit NuoK [Nitrososphaerota archaeon]
MEPLSSYFLLSLVLLAIGIYGLIAKRNAIRLLFAVEIIINSATINFVAFSRYLQQPVITGQTFSLFAIALAATEAAVGLAIIVQAFRLNKDIDVLELKRLKG